MKLAQHLAEIHRRDDIAAGRVDQHQALHVRRMHRIAREVGEDLGRVGFDHPIGDDHIGAARAAVGAPQLRDVELHGLRTGVGEAGREAGDSQTESESARGRQGPRGGNNARQLHAGHRRKRLVGGDGLEPPTLSV